MGGVNIVTPCHGAPLIVLTTPEGPAYMQSDVPSEIVCSADDCYNSWDAEGVSDGWYREKGSA